MTRRDIPWSVVKTLQPGQAGTVKLQRHYGAALVCVRYREDPQGQTRRITVELVIEDKPIRHHIVWATIPAGQIQQRATAIAQGAIWHPRQKMWRMKARTAKLLDLDTSKPCKNR
jgi:hypothetical protein